MGLVGRVWEPLKLLAKGYGSIHLSGEILFRDLIRLSKVQRLLKG